MRRKMVVGNWKMHGNLLENKPLLNAIVTNLNGLQEVSFLVCVPYLYLPSAVGLDEEMVRAYIRDQEKEDERYDQLKLDM